MSFQFLFVNDYFPVLPGHSVKTQSHPHHEIIFYGDGCNGKTIIGDTEYEFHPYNIVINTAGTPHSEIHYAYSNIKYIRFYSDSFDLESKVYPNTSDISNLFDNMKYELTYKLPGYKQMLYHKFQELIICINRSCTTNLSDDPLLPAKKYIKENYAENISMTYLADISGYSTSHFRRLFIDKFGISPKDYLIKKRCQRAIELLKFTNLSCTDIASQCGFYDASQLTKILKSKYSLTPVEIRNQISW